VEDARRAMRGQAKQYTTVSFRLCINKVGKNLLQSPRERAAMIPIRSVQIDARSHVHFACAEALL
jgi:hypothetical protein